MNIIILNTINATRQIAQTTAIDIANRAIAKTTYKEQTKATESSQQRDADEYHAQNKYKSNFEQPTNEDLLSTNGGTSRFGSVVVGNVILNGNNQNIELQEVLLSVTRQNTIIQTPLQGRDGTVKEYITAEDYNIQLVGSIFTDRQNKYPVKEVKALIELLSTKIPIEIESKFLSMFPTIDKVVVKSFDIKQSDKFINRQEFSCSLISDEEINLILS